MSNEEIYEALQNGATYQEIGDILGISRQAVNYRMKYFKRKVCGIRGHSFNIEKIVYQGIYDYFKDNYDQSIASLCKKVHGHANENTLVKFRNFIVGKTDTHLMIKHIKRLSEVTGKSFEELFKRRDMDEQTNTTPKKTERIKTSKAVR